MTHNVVAEKPVGRAGVRTAAVWRSAAALVRGSDVAMIYGLIVVVIAIVLAFVSDATHAHVVLQVSTNLVNLRDRPLWVLFASAFVVSSLVGLWQIPLL